MNVYNDEETSMVKGSKPRNQSRRSKDPTNSKQVTETKMTPTSEQDEGTPPPTMSEKVSPIDEGVTMKKSQEIQEKVKVPQLSSDTKHLRKFKDSERAKNKKMQADIQELANTLQDIRCSLGIDNWNLNVSVRELGDNIGTMIAILKSKSERQDHQKQLIRERVASQEESLDERTQALYDFINAQLTPDKNVRRSRGSSIPVDNSSVNQNLKDW
jgi:hypothetical protein